MIRKAFMMSLNPNQHKEYEKRHNPIWEELHVVLKEHGVSNYSIFLDKETSQLFSYLEIESEEKWKSIANTDVCQRWWAQMKEIMPSNPDNSPIERELKQVFHID